MRDKTTYKDVILVSGKTITPEMEIEPEKLEVLLPEAKKHKEDFMRILLKTKFEKHSLNIYQELQQIKWGNTEALNESIRKSKLNILQYSLDTASLLYVLKTAKNGVYVSSPKSKCLLPSDIKRDLEVKTEKEYKRLDLDLEPMTYEEAKEILSNAFSYPEFDEDGPVGTTAWIMGKYGLVGDDEFTDWCYLGEPDGDLIEEYAEENFTPCNEITPEQIKKTITELEEQIDKATKSGRPIANIKSYAGLLTFIKYGLENKLNEFKIVYDCLDFCGYFSDEQKKNETAKQKDYIKSLFRHCKGYKLNNIQRDNLPF